MKKEAFRIIKFGFVALALTAFSLFYFWKYRDPDLSLLSIENVFSIIAQESDSSILILFQDGHAVYTNCEILSILERYSWKKKNNNTANETVSIHIELPYGEPNIYSIDLYENGSVLVIFEDEQKGYTVNEQLLYELKARYYN